MAESTRSITDRLKSGYVSFIGTGMLSQYTTSRPCAMASFVATSTAHIFLHVLSKKRSV